MRILKGLVLAVALLVAVTVAVAGWLVWNGIHEPFKGYTEAETIVDIPQGTSTAEIATRLVGAGVVADRIRFRAALRLTASSRTLKAGEYRFDRPMTTVEVVDKLARGDVYARRITFPEGLTIPELAEIYEMRGFGKARDFTQAARDPAAVRELDPQARDLEGYLFPETYAVPRSAPAAALVGMMVERFLATYTDDLRARAKEQGLTAREVITLASLVEKETAKAEERPVVAAVYRNRLKRGMAMQADPTIVYALRRAGKYNGNIRRVDLELDSPYNTYKYPGLPPGPIAAPGAASIEAALTPASVPYLYFVSRNDGSHVFAETLQQHNANVYQYQVRYFREQRRAQGERGKASPSAPR